MVRVRLATYHLDRGYSNLEDKLGKCGARLERINYGVDDDEFR